LGLSICKQLIEQMAGSVRVETKLGEGTEFIISLRTTCKISKDLIEDDRFSAISKKEAQFIIKSLDKVVVRNSKSNPSENSSKSDF
jgi:signal transduction histidine kinase